MGGTPQYFLPKGIQAVVLDEEITDSYRHVILAEATGTFNVTYNDGTSHTYTAATVPTYIYGDFKKVNSSGTTIAAASLFRLKVGPSS